MPDFTERINREGGEKKIARDKQKDGEKKGRKGKDKE